MAELPRRVGILGGGQLGRMMILAGLPLGLEFGVVSPRKDDPAARLAHHHVQGSVTDGDAIVTLAEWADILTVEIEHVDTAALDRVAQRGIPVHPSGASLRVINDKFAQKQRLNEAGLPVPAYALEPAAFPTVQKSRFGGYDGHGVRVLRSQDAERLTGPSFFEELVPVSRELAVIVWRTSNGQEGSYPPVEMMFDERANICTHVLSPASVPDSVVRRSQELARASATAVDSVGVTAVELFLDSTGRLLVNEVAPRPHNSGHLTIDSFETSQFEQHLRAITGRVPGGVMCHRPAVMQNLLGHPRADGIADPASLEPLLEVEGCHVHWYGKSIVRPFRKMGHVTVTADSVESALRVLDAVEEKRWIKASEYQE